MERNVNIAANAVRLFPVHEGMVLREAFPERGRLGDDVGVVAGLRPEQGGVELAWVSNTGGAAVRRDLVGVDGENIAQGQVVPHHFASFS